MITLNAYENIYYPILDDWFCRRIWSVLLHNIRSSFCPLFYANYIEYVIYIF